MTMLTTPSLQRGLRTTAVTLALSSLLLAVGPARTASGESTVAAAQADAEGTEVQRFCSNIADAARDRRYALQAKELEKLKSEIDERMKALEAKRVEYEQWLKRRDDFLSKAEDNVVKIYAKMKPDAAAERLAEVRIELAAGILMKLDPAAIEHNSQRNGQQGRRHHHRCHGKRDAQGRPVMIPRFFAAVALAALAGCTSTAFKEIGIPPIMSPVGAGLEAERAFDLHLPRKAGGTGPEIFALGRSPEPAVHGPTRIVGWRHSHGADLDQRPGQAEERIGAQSNHQAALGLAGSFDVDGTGSEASADGDIKSETDTQGQGATTRSESIDLSIAAVVTEVLPNGNLIITGSQEVRVNAELRILTIAGIVRPIDIGAQNTIPYDRIAEARVSYGGRGRLTEVQQPPYGQQILDTVLPF